MVQEHAGQAGVMVGEAAVDSLGKRPQSGPGPALGHLGQHLGAAFTGDEGVDHGPA